MRTTIIAASCATSRSRPRPTFCAPWGAGVDDPAALAAEVSRLSVQSGRALLPTIAAAHGPRAGVDLNIAARDFGASLLWTVNLESGDSRTGVVSTTDCPETWRGEIEGSWITRRRLDPARGGARDKRGGAPPGPLAVGVLAEAVHRPGGEPTGGRRRGVPAPIFAG